MSATTSRRLDFLDTLRGLAAIAVVLFHYILDQGHTGLLSPWQSSVEYLVGDVVDLGKFGVALFFLISGYIIPNSLGPTGDRIGRFCVSRFFRLYPLYWVALVAALYLPWPDVARTFAPLTIAANVTMVQGYLGQPDILGPAWTLQIEMTFYVLCLMLAVVHRLRSPRACMAASLGFLAFATILAIARGVLVMKLPVALPLALSLMFFGTVWRQATLDGNVEARRLAPLNLVAILVMIWPIAYIGYNHDFGYGESWAPYVTCYTLAILTFALCTTRAKLEWRWSSFLGKISYSIYLVHPLVASAAFRAGLDPASTGMDPFVYVGLLTVATILVSWGTYTVVEKPFVQIGHAIVGRRKVAAA